MCVITLTEFGGYSGSAPAGLPFVGPGKPPYIRVRGTIIGCPPPAGGGTPTVTVGTTCGGGLQSNVDAAGNWEVWFKQTENCLCDSQRTIIVTCDGDPTCTKTFSNIALQCSPDGPKGCCDEVTLSIDTQPPCIPSGGSVTVHFTAVLTPGGCANGPFEWKVTNTSNGAILQPFTAGTANFQFSFSSAATYKVNVRVQQSADCDDPVLTDSVTFSLVQCTTCSVSLAGPTSTLCTDGPPTAAQTYTATTAAGFAGSYTWEVRNVSAPGSPLVPPTPVTAGNSFSFAFPGPATYQVTVSIVCPAGNSTAADSLTVTVPPCTVVTSTPTSTVTPTTTTTPTTTSTSTSTSTPTSTSTSTSTSTPTTTTTSTTTSTSTSGSGFSICDFLLLLALILLGIASVGLAVAGCLGPLGAPVHAWAIPIGVSGLAVLALWIAFCRDCRLIRLLFNYFGAMALLMMLLAALLPMVGFVPCAVGATSVAILFGLIVGELGIGIAALGCP